MTKHLILAVLASAILTGAAHSQESKNVDVKLTPAEMTFFKSVKTCLQQANVPIDIDRPGCKLDTVGEKVHLMCLRAYRDVGAKCKSDALKAEQDKTAKW